MKSRLFFNLCRSDSASLAAEGRVRAVILDILLLVFLSGCVFGQTWTDIKGMELPPMPAHNDPKLAINAKGVPFIMYDVRSQRNTRALVKFEKGNWIQIGSQGYSGNTFENYWYTFVLDAAGVPYVIYLSDANFQPSRQRLNIIKFQAGAWISVGLSLVMSMTGNASVIVDATGAPYLIYHNFGSDDKPKLSVVKLENNVWVPVGPPSTALEAGGAPSLAMDTSGILYVAYRDSRSSGKLSVMRLEKGAWISVGSPGFSPNRIRSSSLALDASGVPYVAYVSEGNDYKLSVMKYQDGAWNFVGSKIITKTTGIAPSIEITSAGVPYVAHFDYGFGFSGKEFKMIKFDHGSWISVEPEDIYSESVDMPSTLKK